ncbi:MAG: GTP 3',8-cyclase MoaA [Gemmatimonadales bacterium]|nr:GTP 3',8-cyclase MoaA [Gemmatimonadales bacterium]
MSGVLDRLGRPLGSLRLSVTDRCNMRCRYCMPEEEYAWLPRASLLTYEEMDRLVGVFGRLGVDKVRITGGEPLLRADLAVLVERLAAKPFLTDLALTTNGILLARDARTLREAGLRRVTVSLDTLDPERAYAFARTKEHGRILAGIDAAVEAGYASVKVNAVIIRGFNDDELVPLLEYARGRGIEMRFIEYMDVGGATRWEMGEVVPRREMLARIGAHYGGVEAEAENATSRAPADRFRLPDGTRFGIIASTTEPFCRTCDRARLTVDGTLFTCLYGTEGVDLREPLRLGRDDEALVALLERTWGRRTDRGAELRAALPERGALYQIGALRADPRREMHTRGG